jgi:hypothetical protein
MSTSNAQAKLDYIAGTKTAIKDAIELKGVTVGAATFREYADKIGEISTGGTWQPQPEWIDISTVGDNEINLLVTEGTGIAFSTTVAGAGTYTIDWGDGTVETSRASGTIYMHQHIANGTAWGATYTWKIRIYGATGDITGWKVERHTYTTRKQYHPILWAVFGTMGMTTYANAFYNTTDDDVNCVDLQSCVIPTFASVSNTSDMFSYCRALSSITLPTSWGSVSNTSAMFSYCCALSSITLPTSWGSVSNTSNMFTHCDALSSITLPTSWGSVSNTSNMFSHCYALSSITLPTSWGSVSNTSAMFASCYALSSITLPTSWGSVSNTSNMFASCYALSSITLPTSWGSVSNTSSMFSYCCALSSITLPTSWGSVSNTSYMFASCYSLKYINNIDYLGSISVACDFTDFAKDCEFLQTTTTIASLISKIGIYGASGYKLKVTSIRLTNASSTFGGSSPQVNVSYTDLDATALNTLFGDLPTLTGKTIVIRGCTGAATCDTSIATGKGWTVTN